VPSTPDLPPIYAELRRKLTDDILKRGVLVPILQAEDGEVLDGRLRLEIAQEYKLFCPKIIIGKLSPSERADLRLCVNLYRRHLNQGSSSPTACWPASPGPTSCPTSSSTSGPQG
jgi:ParB-like chromosome segregation protein Spo0J